MHLLELEGPVLVQTHDIRKYMNSDVIYIDPRFVNVYFALD